MDSATLRGRRGIEWSRASAARARGWRLAIDKPSLLGSGEGMATIVVDPQCEVWGVLYDITASDFEHLELTEGVRIDHYRRTEIVVEPLVTGEAAAEPSVPALTVTSDERNPSLRPTRRYMRLLVSGAQEHGLPATWIERLRSIEAVDSGSW